MKFWPLWVGAPVLFHSATGVLQADTVHSVCTYVCVLSYVKAYDFISFLYRHTGNNAEKNDTWIQQMLDKKTLEKDDWSLVH